MKTLEEVINQLKRDQIFLKEKTFNGELYMVAFIYGITVQEILEKVEQNIK